MQRCAVVALIELPGVAILGVADWDSGEIWGCTQNIRANLVLWSRRSVRL